MQQLDVYYYLLSQYISGIIMPIFRRKKALTLHLAYFGLFLLDVVGSGCAGSQYSHPTRQHSTTTINHIQQKQTNIHQMQ